MSSRSDSTISARPAVAFLDLGDTLVRAHPSWAGVYRQGLRAWGIEVDEAQLEEALRAATQSDAWTFEGPFEASEEASYERIKRFDAVALARLGYRDLPDDVFRSIEQAFDEVSSWHIFPDVLPSVEALREAGIRLGVISNWPWGGMELLHSLELARHFEALVISARVGYQKPHPSIFEHALELCGVAPAAALHVGDNHAADVVGARRVGISPVLIDRRRADHGRLRQELGEPELPIVHDLYGLLDLLGIERPAQAARPA